MAETEIQKTTPPLLTFAVFILGALAFFIAAVSAGSLRQVQRIKPPGVIERPDRDYYPSMPPAPNPKNPEDPNFAKRTQNYTPNDFKELERVRQMKLGEVSQQHEELAFSLLTWCRILIGIFIAIAAFMPRFFSPIACANSFLCLIGLNLLTRILFIKEETMTDVSTFTVFNVLCLAATVFYYVAHCVFHSENIIGVPAAPEIVEPGTANISAPVPQTKMDAPPNDTVEYFSFGMALVSCVLITSLAVSIARSADKFILLGPQSMLIMGIAGLIALWSIGLPFIFSTFRWSERNARTFGVSVATLLALAAIFFLR